MIKLRAIVNPPQVKLAHATPLLLSLVAIEAAPAQAWLIVYAAAQQGDARLAAAPFWLLVGILLLFALARWLLARYGALAVGIGLVISVTVSVLALSRFSPLMLGNERFSPLSLSWLSLLFSGKLDYSGLGGLIALALYMGWRGIELGRPAPAFSQVSRRFSIGLGALTLAIFGSLASARVSMRDVSAALLILLALEGFGGLSALALSRPLAGSGRTDAVMPGAENSIRWQVTAIVFAFVIVACVTLIGGVLNVSAAHSLLAWLGPVGSLLNLISYWLTQMLAYVLYLISVFGISNFVPTNLPNQPVHTPHAPPPKQNAHQTQLDPSVFVGTASLILGALAIIMTLFLLIYLARAIANAESAAEEVEEERERLDASSLLRQQMRDLLNRRRAGREGATDEESLKRGSVRWLYRELLRAGARVGYERGKSETADEYAARISETLDIGDRLEANSTVNEFHSLARAYDDARYGAVEGDPPASGEVAAQTRRVIQRINALGK